MEGMGSVINHSLGVINLYLIGMFDSWQICGKIPYH